MCRNNYNNTIHMMTRSMYRIMNLKQEVCRIYIKLYSTNTQPDEILKSAADFDATVLVFKYVLQAKFTEALNILYVPIAIYINVIKSFY